MIKRISLLALFSLCAVVQAQSQHHLVKGITLNDSLAKVKQHLGQPTSEALTEPNECNDGAPDMQLRYPGMVVTLSTPTGQPSIRLELPPMPTVPKGEKLLML